jgi:hypothetical protein
MPYLDVHYVTREGKSVLSGLDQAFLQSGQPAGVYHFVMHELLATLAGAGARLIMDGHGGDHTLHPRGQAALATSRTQHFPRLIWRRSINSVISLVVGVLRLLHRTGGPWVGAPMLGRCATDARAFL